VSGPLAGRLVLDFSTLLPGPICTLLLAEAGAEVIKIERPAGGDEMRAYPPAWGSDGVNFALLNRGKRSLALDLKDAADRARLDPLLARADVIVEQFRPGVMGRLGLDYESVAKSNPGIVYCSITGWGQDGPRRLDAGHDLNYAAATGLLSLSHGETAHPVVPPALIADIAGGAWPAVMNIAFALLARERSGHGAHLDIAMTDNLFPFLYWALGNAHLTGRDPVNGGELVTGGSPRYHLYPTADGRLVAAAPLEQRFWENFCDLIELPAELRDDARDPAATTAAVATIIAGRDAATWQAAFDGRDVCCNIVATVTEVLAEPHFAARGLFAGVLANGAGARMPALHVPLAASLRPPPGEARSAPALGADNARLAP
jgi:alpha-methylacyl-CoA racemase